uniref:Putative c2h2-type zn-finger protein n=1 Tax=Culex tarsalis TaxID=7177 RepID=A0A1Q3EVV0_CULTA
MDGEDSDFAPPSPDIKRSKKHRFQCDICYKVFRGTVELSRHKEIHLDPANRPRFGCKICPAMFKSRAGLKYHLNKHSEPVDLPCPDCGKVFRSIEGRKIHMTISHGANGPTFRCRECPMVFARRFHLKLHMATHGSGRNLCARCGKSYAWPKDLRKHEAKCSEGNPERADTSGGAFHCGTCGLGFETERSLKNHVARHPTSMEHDKSKTQKARQRRSKNDVFLGRDHLVQAYVSTEPEPAESKGECDRKNKQCQYCPMKYIHLKALRNHERRKHWQLLGVKRAAETRGRPKKVKKIGRKKVAGPSKVQKQTNYEQLEEFTVKEDNETFKHDEQNVFEEGKVQSDAEKHEPFERVDIKEEPSTMESSIEHNETVHDQPKPSIVRKRSRFRKIVMREVRVFLENVCFPVQPEQNPRGGSR